MMAEKTPKIRLGNLDLLRIIAAIMVLLYHFTYVAHVNNGIGMLSFPEIDPFTQHLWAGVSLFFMISGFVIAFSAERASAYDFMVSRVARLYPAFLFCMTVTAVFLLAAAPQQFVEFQVSLARYFANLTMVPLIFKQPFIDGAYWSIVTEITFYFWVTVFIALGLYQKHLLRILFIWMVISIVNEFWLGNAIINKALTSQYGCYFVLGILSYRSFSQKRGLNWPEWVVAILALIMSLKSDHIVTQWMINNYSYATEFSWIRSLMKTLAFLAILNIAVRIPPLLSSSLCYTIGGLTYPLYLLHSNIGFTLFHQFNGQWATLNRWVSFAIVTGLMLALSYLVFRYIEPAGRKLIITLFAQIKPRLIRIAPQFVR
jgi:peptidoglycan/LPS O-acetylase OafA/YrhL